MGSPIEVQSSTLLDEPRREIESTLSKSIEMYWPARTTPTTLRNALTYALLGGGKRLRPLLCGFAAEACGGRFEMALQPAAAIECVHTFSLIHDDLPALDNDDLRRGMPTVHRQFGEAMGILAGDALLNMASQILAAIVPRETSTTLAQELSQATTLMIAGQVADTLGEPDAPDQSAEHCVRSIHARKTGALIVAACRMGMISARSPMGRRRGEPADQHAMEAITRFAEAVGLMFQITDDLLDVEGTPEQTGKRTRKDATAGKLTFPSVLGVEPSKREVERLLAQSHGHLERFGDLANPLKMLATQIASRQS
jgi:geranylgeranyl diphosphate synthase, type II